MAISPFSKKLDPNDPMPRYYQLYDALRSRMESGEFSPGSMLPTEKELGEEYGVSRITVIKALDILELEGKVERQQGRGTLVLEKVGEKSTGTLLPRTVALVCHALSHPYLAGILVGIAAVLARESISLQVFGSVDSSQSEALAVQRAVERGINGLILLPWSDFQNQALYKDLIANGLPVVMVDRFYPDIKTDIVVFDDQQASFEITSRLIHRGHRKIAFAIADEVLPTSVHARLAGYKAALEANGLTYDENLVWMDVSAITQDFRERPQLSGVERKLIDNLHNERPTALFAVNYDVAEFVLYILHTLSQGITASNSDLRGFEIGAFCHNPAPISAPYISVLAMQSGDLIGSAAAEMVVGRLNQTLPLSPQHQTLPIKIVEFK